MNSFRALVSAVVITWLSATPAQPQEFGSTIVLNNNEILIGEPFDPVGPGPDGNPRTLYIYSNSDSGWAQTGTLQAPDNGGADFFGRFVIQDSDQLLVGATALDSNGDGEPDGSVLIYGRGEDGWTYESELRPESVPFGSSYGRFASLTDEMLVVTALGYSNTDGAAPTGAAWVFTRGSDGTWVEQAILTPTDPHPEQEFFGWGVHTDGDRVIVGAFGGPTIPGAAYIFGRDDEGNWAQEARLALPDDESQPGAGAAGGGIAMGVGINDTYALLGLPGADGGAGIVLRYERRTTGDWVRTGELAAFDRQPGAFFGASFHGHENELWISAPGADGLGAIYAFTWDAATETFGAAKKIRAGQGSDVGDGFGLAMASTPELAVIGQPWDDSGLGSVIVLENHDGTWNSTSKIFLPEQRRELLALSDVTCGDNGLADQFTCDQVDVLSFMPLDAIGGTDRGIETNDVWGWADPQTGREYALVGRTDGTAFIDVSNPNSPIYLGSLAKTLGSRTNSWRDIKVFNNHAFIVADGAGDHGMQIFDLTRLRDVRDTPVEFDVDALYEGIASAHNVVINEETSVAYIVGSSGGGETCGGGLHMMDLEEPTSPTFIGCFQDVGTGRRGTGYAHDAMCVVYDGPDTEHIGQEICFGSNETALSIADVTDRENPVSLASATYPNVTYAHQGWITEDHRHFYMNDELDEDASVARAEETDTEPDMSATRTLVWDVSDLDDPVLVNEHFGETFTIDHNLYIVGDLMYQSNYVSGLRVLDISDRENPEEVGFFDTVPWDESVVFDGSWSNYPFFESGTVVVSSGKEGVFFLKYRRPELVP